MARCVDIMYSGGCEKFQLLMLYIVGFQKDTGEYII